MDDLDLTPQEYITKYGVEQAITLAQNTIKTSREEIEAARRPDDIDGQHIRSLKAERNKKVTDISDEIGARDRSQIISFSEGKLSIKCRADNLSHALLEFIQHEDAVYDDEYQMQKIPDDIPVKAQDVAMASQIVYGLTDEEKKDLVGQFGKISPERREMRRLLDNPDYMSRVIQYEIYKLLCNERKYTQSDAHLTLFNQGIPEDDKSDFHIHFTNERVPDAIKEAVKRKVETALTDGWPIVANTETTRIYHLVRNSKDNSNVKDNRKRKMPAIWRQSRQEKQSSDEDNLPTIEPLLPSQARQILEEKCSKIGVQSISHGDTPSGSYAVELADLRTRDRKTTTRSITMEESVLATLYGKQPEQKHGRRR